MHRLMPCALYPVSLALAIIVTSASGCLGAGTPAGTAIECRSDATFTDDAGQFSGTSASNVATLTVARKAAVSINPASYSGPTSPGRPVTLAATLQNLGNAADTFALSTTSSLNWPTVIYLDDNGDGTRQDTETTVVTSTASVPPDSTAKFLLRVAVPSSAKAGEQANIGLSAKSGFTQTASASGLYRINTVAASNDLPVAAAPASPAVGEMITVTAQLPVSRPLPVEFSAILPGGSTKTCVATADANGRATWSVLCDASGSWSISGYWAGDDSHLASGGTAEISCQPPSYFVQGIDLVTIPISMYNSSPSSLWTSESVAAIAKWIPDQARYALYDPSNGVTSESAFTSIDPGLGYWISSAEGITLRPEGRLADQTQPSSHQLRPGWNQIGSVYLRDTDWKDARVLYNGSSYTTSQAYQLGLMHDYAWLLDRTAGDCSYHVLDTALPGTPTLIPAWRALWVYAEQSVTLQLAAPSAAELGEQRRRTPRGQEDPDRKPPAPGEWTMALHSRCGSLSDSDNFIGVSADRSVYAVANPPRSSKYEDIYFTGSDGQLYATDMRQGLGRENVWEFEVAASNTADRHELTWSGIENVPDEYSVVLTDVSAGLSTRLDQISSYSFHIPDAGAPRKFRLTLTRD